MVPKMPELGAGKMAEWIESLLHKHEVLKSDPYKNLDMTVHVFNSKAGSRETGGSLESKEQLILLN